MSGDTQARHVLHDRLVEAIGREAADTLMEALPPVPWSDLATKDDIARIDVRLDGIDGRLDGIEGTILSLEERLLGRMETMEHRITAAFRGEIIAAMTSQTRSAIFGYLGSVISTAGIVIAAAKLL